tara:strand:+ start:384 stop:1106 length:723 start_codon:yes stop_codon:yes gene_type:complete
MTKLLKVLSAVFLFLGLLSMPVKAGSGFAIGIYGIQSTFDTEGTEIENPGIEENQERTGTSITEDVDFGSIFAEVALHEGYAGVTFGIEYVPGAAEIGSKSRTDVTTDATEANQDDNTYTAKAEVTNHISLYAEPTLYVTGDGENQLGFYAKLGGSRVDVNTLEDISSGTDSSTYDDETVYGGIFGIGIRAKHSSGVLIKAEWTQTHYQTIELVSDSGNKNKIEADIDQEDFRIALGYQF